MGPTLSVSPRRRVLRRVRTRSRCHWSSARPAVVTLDGTFVVSGVAAAGALVSVVDGAGEDITADPKVGINELLVITINWTDANGNPIANGTLAGPGGPPATPIATLGLLTAPTGSNDAGNTTVTYVAGGASGIATFTAVIDAAVVQFNIEVGDTGGGVIDSLASANGVDVDAAVGAQVQLTVLASIEGVPAANAIIQFESNSARVTPELPSSNAAGEASTFVTSSVAGVVVVTATAVTQGVGGVLIPVQGIDTVIFTITFGGTSVQLSTGAVSTFLGWSGPRVDSSTFDGVAGLVIIWWWNENDAEWTAFVPGSDIAALQNVFVVDTFDVIFIVTTGETNVGI